MSWAFFKPELDDDGSVQMYKLVINFDSDWQNFALYNDGVSGQTFEVDVTPEMADDLPRMLEASRVSE